MGDSEEALEGQASKLGKSCGDKAQSCVPWRPLLQSLERKRRGESEERGRKGEKERRKWGWRGDKNESCVQWVLQRRTERNRTTGKEEVKCLSPDFTSTVPFSVKINFGKASMIYGMDWVRKKLEARRRQALLCNYFPNTHRLTQDHSNLVT